MDPQTSMSATWGAAFVLLLLVACITDVRSRRIPNALVATLLVVGVAYSASAYSLWEGLLRSTAGIGVGFAIWIGFHVVGVIGAGDVKFFSAVGAWLGVGATWRAAVFAALAGGVLAAFYLVRQRRLAPAVRGIWLAAASGSLAVARVADDDAARRHRSVPYGVAMAAGALVAAWWPGLLA